MMRHLLKYLGLYEQLCSGAIILCALSIGGASMELVDKETTYSIAALSFVILLFVVIAKIWLSEIGKNAIQRGDEVG